MLTRNTRAVVILSAAGLAVAVPGSSASAQSRAQIFLNDTIVVEAPGNGRFLSPVLGDANGDGVPDLLAVRRGGSEFRVLPSTGRAKWAEAAVVAQLAPEIEVQDVAVGDVDADGDPDIIYWAMNPSSEDRLFGALLNDGFGGFGVMPQVAASLVGVDETQTQSQFDTIASGDVTGDGVADLVVASRDLVILEGDGSGGFAPPEVISADDNSVELVDIDGDGVDEIVSAGFFGLTIRQRQGSGWAVVGSDPLDSAISNATNLVSAERCDGQPGVRLLAGESVSTFGGVIELLTVSPAFGITSDGTAQLDGGEASFAAADVLGGPQSDFLTAGGGVLPDLSCGGITIEIPIVRQGGSVVRSADVDLNGNADIATSVPNGIAISRIIGSDTARAVELAPIFETEIPGFTGTASGITSGDFDGDGLRDVVVSTGNNASSAVFYQEPDGSFTGLLLTETSRSPRTHAADLDADGLDDVVLITNGVNVQVNFAEPGRSFAPRVGYSVGAAPREARTADIDNDGDLDIVAHTVDGLTVLEQTAPRVFELASTLAIQSSQLGLALGDLDGDGDTDVVVGSASDFGVQIALNDGAGAFAAAVSIDPTFSPESFSLADLDGDGDLDLVAVAQFGSTSIALYENDGNAEFTRVAEFDSLDPNAFLGEQWVETGDFDGDGATDIATASDAGHIQVLRGDGDFGFTPVVVGTSVSNDLNQFVLDDFNADGFPDLAMVSYDERGFAQTFGGFQLLLNQTRPRDLCPADLAPPAGTLDLADITAFVNGFQGMGDAADADLAAPFGTLDLADIAAFVTVFVDGCS